MANLIEFTASVTAVAFHPSGLVAAVGSADFSIRVFTTYLEEADDKSLNYKGPFGGIKTYGEELYKIKNAGSWVENLRWNDAGDLLAAAGRLLLLEIDVN